MTIRILGLLAAIATLATLSTPSFASTDEAAAPAPRSDVAASPTPHYCAPWMRDCNPDPYRCEPWMRDCRPPMERFACFARNIFGRTFVAYGNFRTPRDFVLFRALQQCRYQSLPFIARTCHVIGCRSMGGFGYGGGYDGGYDGGYGR